MGYQRDMRIERLAQRRAAACEACEQVEREGTWWSNLLTRYIDRLARLDGVAVPVAVTVSILIGLALAWIGSPL